jgi:hypothetical protein
VPLQLENRFPDRERTKAKSILWALKFIYLAVVYLFEAYRDSYIASTT